MRRLSIVITLLAPVVLACESKDDDTAGSTGATDGTGSPTGATESGATESGATDNNGPGPVSDGGTDSSGDEGMTTANSVTTPPMTEPTGPSGDPTDTTETTATVTSANPTDPSGADPDEAVTQLCVDTINMYRASIGLPALERWSEQEDCADAECLSDGMTNTPHGAFGMCGESAQNECPGWGGPPEQMITACLELMWNEGPGEDFNKHGHYINMSNPDFTRVSCGFAEVNGQIWAVQNFG